MFVKQTCSNAAHTYDGIAEVTKGEKLPFHPKTSNNKLTPLFCGFMLVVPVHGADQVNIYFLQM